MNEFFKDADKEVKSFIPPDYSTMAEDEDEPNIDELIDSKSEDEDEAMLNLVQSSIQQETNEKIMSSTSPFSTPSSTPSWNTGWGNTNPVNTNPWSTTPKTTPWNSQSAWGGGLSTGAKVEINRNKKVIFCDLIDCITEPYQAEGRPGLRPRDIYDFKFKFDVWQKIAAFNPNMVFIMIPQNLLPVSANGLNSWDVTLGYICCCLSAFLRLPDTNCQVLLQSKVGQRKEEMISSTLKKLRVPLEEVVQIGIYSGSNGLSDMDKVAAERCKIDYIDLYQLLNMGI